MSKTEIPVVERTAIWRANGQKCFYCGEPIPFFDLEIDHLIPQSARSHRVAQLVKELGLRSSFAVDDLENLVPTHHLCNKRKSAHVFSEESLRYYFELWSSKVERVKEELARLQRQSRNEYLLSEVASRVEGGLLTFAEVVQFLKRATHERRVQTTEPMVICFGLSIEDLDFDSLPAQVPHDYAHLCDWLEKNLLHRLGEEIPSLSVMTEDGRDGETLSVRVAFWNLDVQHLEGFKLPPWRVLEVAYYTEIYPGDWQELFSQAVVATYHAIVRDEDDPLFGIRRCPRCGSKNLQASMTYHRDDLYFEIVCPDCGWSDWTH